MALPSIICIKSVNNNKYLRYTTGDSQVHGLLKFSAEFPIDSLAQFEVVPSSIHDGLVHIKSRYTDKFFVRWSPKESMITASANTLNEDKTNWGCTLFKPDGETNKIRLRHIELDAYARISSKPSPFESCLFIETEENISDSSDIISIVDWTSILNLTKNVTFSIKDKYLGVYVDKGITYLQFSYDNPNDPKVGHEVTTFGDGTMVIKSKYNGKYWRLGDDDYIVADVVEPSLSNTGVLFRANKTDVNVVALLNMKKIAYCKLYTHILTAVLRADTQSTDVYSTLTVKDLGE